MVWDCFAVSAPGRVALHDGTMSSALFQKILKDSTWASVHVLKLKHIWVLQQDHDLKHKSKSASKWKKSSN